MSMIFKSSTGTMIKVPISTEGVVGNKKADAIHKVNMGIMRRQIISLPDLLVEDARNRLFLEEDTRRKDLQTHQLFMVCRVEGILHKQMHDKGIDSSKFRIGGHDRATYETFFRTEPARTMTKAQLNSALRKCFGDGIVKDAASINKLFESFDPERRDEMDWRSFLYILTIILQPFSPLITHLRYGFALYVSNGSLDMESRDSMKFEEIKNFICSPVLLSKRGELCDLLDDAWLEFANMDIIAAQQAQGNKTDFNDAMINFKLFERILNETKLRRYLQMSEPYGKRDPRPWIFRLESDFYHSYLYNSIKKRRRIIRNDLEADEFIRRVIVRKKEFIIMTWRHFVAIRNKIRHTIIVASIRWRNDQCGRCFDIWRDVTIATSAVNHVQRMIRGFIARRRRKFIRRINRQVTILQSKTRQMRLSTRYNQLVTRRRWAVNTIARMVRGWITRRRVKTTVEALYDTGKRQLQKIKDDWINARRKRAAIRIQMAVRKMRVNIKVTKRLMLRREMERIRKEMEAAIEENRVNKTVFRQELQDWYKERKLKYDMETMSDAHTAEAKAKIIAYRNRMAELEKEQAAKLKEELLEKQEEARIEAWLAAWEIKKQDVCKAKSEECNRVLVLPETPEEVLLKKSILDRVKKQIPIVLKRADKQKIPMEVFEAREVAIREVIDAEVEALREALRKQQFDEATAYEENMKIKKQEEIDNITRQKRFRRKWAIVTIQGAYRCYLANKVKRQRAYERYRKHYDEETNQYFYEDKRSKKCSWNKPKSLGSYDILPDEGWMVLGDTEGDPYFYNPRTWEMAYDKPFGTYLCDKCQVDFAVCYLNMDKAAYCDKCFTDKVTKELLLTYKAEEITFKPFHGHKEEAANVQFRYVKDTNWHKYLFSSNDDDSDDDEEDKDKPKKPRWVHPKCIRCEEKNADCMCDICGDNYCTECYAFKHKKPPWDGHTFSDIIIPKEALEPEKPVMKSVKMKKKVKAPRLSMSSKKMEKKLADKKPENLIKNYASGKKSKSSKKKVIIPSYLKELQNSNSNNDSNSNNNNDNDNDNSNSNNTNTNTNNDNKTTIDEKLPVIQENT